jgi:hypothetical protein
MLSLTQSGHTRPFNGTEQKPEWTLRAGHGEGMFFVTNTSYKKFRPDIIVMAHVDILSCPLTFEIENTQHSKNWKYTTF